MKPSVLNTPVPSLLDQVYETVAQGQDRQASIQLLRFTETLLRDEGFRDTNDLSRLDTLLQTVDVSRLGAHCMIALLRGNYRVRTRLQHWEGLLHRVNEEMIHRELNYKQLLIGLIQ